jgi:hypothetical protein
MKCANPECQKEYTPHSALQSYCSKACQKRHYRAVHRDTSCRMCGGPREPRKVYCEKCRAYVEKTREYKSKCQTPPPIGSALPPANKCETCGKKLRMRGGLYSPVCKECQKKAEEKRVTFTAEQIEMIRAAHGGKGEICQNCRRPFLRTYRGQVYCRRPECAKAAEREAMRMEAA